MSAGAVAAKNAPIVLPLAGIAISGDQATQVMAVAAGLVFGAMWRAGSLYSEGKGGKAVGADLLVSVLIGFANLVLALTVADLLGLGPLLTMAVGTIIGATGLRALPEIKAAAVSWATRRLLGDNVALVQPDEPKINAAVEALKKDKPQ